MIAYIVSAIVVAAIMDRFCLQRSALKNLRLGTLEYVSQAIRVPFYFEPSRKRLKGASVSYLFRDANNPTTVIDGRSRPLETSLRGENSQYLYVAQKKIHSAGVWIMTVHVTHGDSLWNPLYRIFPMKYEYSREFNIETVGEQDAAVFQ